jgi:perosamine synthetase
MVENKKPRPIPVNEPLLTGKEREYLAQCIQTGWISSEGPFVREFEKRFSKTVERKHGISVCNGSAALEAAVAALGLGPGDEVILPAFTIISCAAAVVRNGATPVFVDCDPFTWNMDVGRIEPRITSRTKGIMAVHIYGLPVDMDPLLRLAKAYNLSVIEDAAEAHGLTYKGKPCGSLGDISTFSFYPNKLVTTGEGGMILTDRDDLAESCRSLRNLCFQPQRRFVHERLGWNMRMSNVQAAIGLAQLKRLHEFLEIKRRMGRRYTELLQGIAGLQFPVPSTRYAKNAYWVYGLVLKDEIPFDASEAMARLAELGIGTRPFFWPMHEQPVLQKLGISPKSSYPVSERLARRGFYIPSGLALKEEQIDRVVDALRKALA